MLIQTASRYRMAFLMQSIVGIDHEKRCLPISELSLDCGPVAAKSGSYRPLRDQVTYRARRNSVGVIPATLRKLAANADGVA